MKFIRCANCAKGELRGIQIEGEPDAMEVFCHEWMENLGPDEYCSRWKEKDA